MFPWRLYWLCQAIIHVTAAIVPEIEGRDVSRVIGAATADAKRRFFCPRNCICQSLLGGVYCTSVPWPSLPPATTTLNIVGLKDTSITYDDLRALPNLISLNVSGAMSALPQFPHLSQLLHLDLSNNFIRDASPGSLDNLGALTSLDLSRNELTKLDAQLFHRLNNLLSIDISDNPIISIDADALKGVPNLLFLNLSSIQLSTVPTSLFISVPKLTYLYLSDNYLHGIPAIDCKNLNVLDLSYNFLTDIPFIKHENLEKLYIGHNPIRHLDSKAFSRLYNVKILHINNLNITELNNHIFSPLKALEVIELSNNVHLKRVGYATFNNLKFLKIIKLNGCSSLKEFASNGLDFLPRLAEIDLRNTGLHVLPSPSKPLPSLHALNMEGTVIQCDCHLDAMQGWFHFGPLECHDGVRRNYEELKQLLLSLECKRPEIISGSDYWIRTGWGGDAVLPCNSTGNPKPQVIWQTSNLELYASRDFLDDIELVMNNSQHNQQMEIILNHLALRAYNESDVFQVLDSGALYVHNVDMDRSGRYKCFSFNVMSNSTSTVFLAIDDAEFRRFINETYLLGLACAVGFLVLTLTAQLIKYITERISCACCCCCKDRLSPKARKVRKLLESVEAYKSQQLDRLRENYNSQMTSIKESCYQQMERIRESYWQQGKNLKDLRDYSTQQLTSVRDQYVEQMNKVRDYSTSQMNRVRENYVFQRTRIRKFSAHQLLKLRETYKYQQKTLNKIMENLPDLYLQTCRTGGNCHRTDSLEFDELEGLDMYYKLDFLDAQSHNSDYYTPTSTLSRAGHLKQQRMYSCSRTNSSTSTDFQEAQSVISRRGSDQNVQSHKLQRKNQVQNHARSLSITCPYTAIKQHPELARVHKRSQSMSHQNKSSSSSGEVDPKCLGVKEGCGGTLEDANQGSTLINEVSLPEQT